ncbi:MAG: hypothetical protein WBO00_09755 [Steroidobacteraceae bacterium]
MRRVITCLTCFLLLAACGRESGDSAGTGDDSTGARTERAASTAVLKKDIDLAGCLAEEIKDDDTAPSACPTYILQSLDYMIQECSRVGGELAPLPESAAWSLDIEADGNAEILLDLTQNYTCQGAPSVFSCGSLGCPYFLYTQSGEAWDELGAINADDAPGIDVLRAKPGERATLRGGCSGQRPCSELTHYTWNGNAYDRSLIEYRGHKVDVAPGGLWTLTRKSPVLAGPSPDAPVLDEYPEGTTVVVIGAARSAPYKFVSPCNACRRGFVDAAALKQ